MTRANLQNLQFTIPKIHGRVKQWLYISEDKKATVQVIVPKGFFSVFHRKLNPNLLIIFQLVIYSLLDTVWYSIAFAWGFDMVYGKIEHFQERVNACAIIMANDKPEKIVAIAEERNVDATTAARMYVLGALKASIRRGSAVNMADALERFEDSQIGDRSVSVHGEAPINREVRRIDHINRQWSIEEGIEPTHERKESKAARPRRNMGKCLGELYTAWDASIMAYNPETIAEDDARASVEAKAAIARYIAEYVSRLSRTARATIRDVKATRYDVDAIMKGATPETAKMKERVKYLHHNFPARDSVTARELLSLLREYAA